MRSAWWVVVNPTPHAISAERNVYDRWWDDLLVEEHAVISTGQEEQQQHDYTDDSHWTCE